LFLREAIQIATSVQMQDFQKFFKIFKRTNYMFACLMLRFFEEMRGEALHAFRRNAVKIPIAGSFVAKTLLLPEQSDCYNCLLAFGFQPDPKTCNISHDRAGSD
jgi:hypothetical protein